MSNSIPTESVQKWVLQKAPNLKFIGDQRRVVLRNDVAWVVVPKNGTNAIKRWLGCNLARHAMPTQKVDFSRIKSCLMITRNPFDRLLSCYTDKVLSCGARSAVTDNSPPGLARCSFLEFVDVVAQIPDRFSDPHFRSQHALTNGIPSDIKIHYIDLYDLDTQYDFLSELMQISGTKRKKFPHLNKAAKKSKGPLSYQSWYEDDQKAINKVRERFYIDLEKFNYSFEGKQ